MKVKDLVRLDFETDQNYYIIKATRMHERYDMSGRYYTLNIVEASKKVFSSPDQYKGKVNKFGVRIMFDFMFKESDINKSKEIIASAYILFRDLAEGKRKLNKYYVV